MKIERAVIAAMPCFALAPLAFAGNRPNVIFILTDDQRYDAVGYMGNPYMVTPVLDSLANRGTIFSNARATNPISCASRACILTGLYSRTSGIYDFDTPFTETQERLSYPAIMKANGYYTGFIGKYGAGTVNPEAGGVMFDYAECLKGQGAYYKSLMPHGNVKGKENPDPDEKHLTEIQGDQVLDFLRNRDPEKPFCLSVSFKAPHCQDELREIGDEFPIDPRDSSLYEGVRFSPSLLCNDEYYEEMAEAFRTNSEGAMNIARYRWQFRFSTDSLYQETVRKYYSLIHGVDREIGRMTEELRRQGIDGNTVIIFMGDNGYYLGEYGLAGKWFHHEESLRVPLFIYDPRDPEGRINTANALNIDIAPTILSFAGLKCKDMQGKNLAKKFRRKGLYFEYSYSPASKKFFIPSMEGVIDGDFKLVRYNTPDSTWISLYDMGKEMGETSDIVSDNPRKVKRLRKMMERLRGCLSSSGNKAL
ncbi:MAG: sulfatase-like hydrolase/transferase [Bacteroidales bacterium]|nr:sulfatase-like hydrolase/transferase [Bacteroidales bacterium]